VPSGALSARRVAPSLQATTADRPDLVGGKKRQTEEKNATPFHATTMTPDGLYHGDSTKKERRLNTSAKEALPLEGRRKERARRLKINRLQKKGAKSGSVGG